MERDGWRLKLLCYCRITKAKHKFRGLETGDCPFRVGRWSSRKVQSDFFLIVYDQSPMLNRSINAVIRRLHSSMAPAVTVVPIPSTPAEILIEDQKDLIKQVRKSDWKRRQVSPSFVSSFQSSIPQLIVRVCIFGCYRKDLISSILCRLIYFPGKVDLEV
jgi:hypothetical protein